MRTFKILVFGYLAGVISAFAFWACAGVIPLAMRGSGEWMYIPYKVENGFAHFTIDRTVFPGNYCADAEHSFLNGTGTFRMSAHPAQPGQSLVEGGQVAFH